MFCWKIHTHRCFVFSHSSIFIWTTKNNKFSFYSHIFLIGIIIEQHRPQILDLHPCLAATIEERARLLNKVHLHFSQVFSISDVNFAVFRFQRFNVCSFLIYEFELWNFEVCINKNKFKFRICRNVRFIL